MGDGSMTAVMTACGFCPLLCFDVSLDGKSEEWLHDHGLFRRSLLPDCIDGHFIKVQSFYFIPIVVKAFATRLLRRLLEERCTSGHFILAQLRLQLIPQLTAASQLRRQGLLRREDGCLCYLFQRGSHAERTMLGMAIPGSYLVNVDFWVGSGWEYVVGDAKQVVLSCCLMGLQRALPVGKNGVRSYYPSEECWRRGCIFVIPAPIVPPHQLNIMNHCFHQQISYQPTSFSPHLLLSAQKSLQQGKVEEASTFSQHTPSEKQDGNEQASNDQACSQVHKGLSLIAFSCIIEISLSLSSCSMCLERQPTILLVTFIEQNSCHTTTSRRGLSCPCKSRTNPGRSPYPRANISCWKAHRRASENFTRAFHPLRRKSDQRRLRTGRGSCWAKSVRNQLMAQHWADSSCRFRWKCTAGKQLQTQTSSTQHSSRIRYR